MGEGGVTVAGGGVCRAAGAALFNAGGFAAGGESASSNRATRVFVTDGALSVTHPSRKAQKKAPCSATMVPMATRWRFTGMGLGWPRLGGKNVKASMKRQAENKC